MIVFEMCLDFPDSVFSLESLSCSEFYFSPSHMSSGVESPLLLSLSFTLLCPYGMWFVFSNSNLH